MKRIPAFIVETPDGRVIVSRLDREGGPTIVIEIHRTDVRFIEVDLHKAGEIGKAIQELSSR